MGCFNYRCAVSNGNILPRDKVAVVFFGHGGYRSKITLPVFFAEYNDYGWFENVAPESQAMFDIVRKIVSKWYHNGYCTTSRSYSRGDLPAVDKNSTELLTEDQLSNVFHEFAVHSNNPNGGYPNRIEYMMIHRSIYEEMVGNYKTIKNWRGQPIFDGIRESMMPPPFLQNALSSIPDDAPALYKSIATMSIKFAANSAVETITDMSTTLEDYRSMIRMMKNDIPMEDQIDHIGQLTVFEMKMDQYHIPWVESGSTDQEYTYKDGIKYHEMCLKHLKQKQVDWDKDRDWEDEDEEDDE